MFFVIFTRLYNFLSMKRLLFLFGLIALGAVSYAQCLMYPVLLSQRIPQSSLIVEGKVINQKSFWNSAHNHIFTSNLVEVYKSFKGNATTYLEVITEGGVVGNDMHRVEPSLELEIGDLGVFTLISNTENSQFNKPVYETYAVAQGFIKYDVANNVATEPFNKYTNISVSLYPTIEQFAGQQHTVVKPFNAFQTAQPVINSLQAVAAITSFTPTSITAGTYSVLTINGSGFGASAGTVSFKNADDGGATFINALPSEIVSWSATQIQVKVPTDAGTGVIQVNGVSSTQTLTIPYSHLNVSTGTPTVAYMTRHVAKQSGGYVWTYNNNFITNLPAKAAFERSLQSWRCATFINWTLSGSTSTVSAAAGGDGVNIVTFNGSLGAGVLGNCYSYWSGCGTAPNMNWFVSELDIQFSNTPGGLSWQFGPAAPTGSQYDFESVTVHELGHGHQLGHVINSSDLMHYALANGQQKRTLNTDDLNGGLFVMNRNAAAAICSQTNMTPLTAGNCALGAPTASFTANKQLVCTGQTVVFTNLSTGSPTANAWVFAGGTPSTSSVTNPTITYNTPGTYSVSLTATNANGSNTYSVIGYITVGGSSLPLTQDFQSATFPPANWSLVDAGNDGIKWQLTSAAGQASTQSALFDNWSDSVTGKLDQIKTQVNLSGYSAASMTFYRAYGATFASPYSDTLEIRISTDCGTTSTQKYLRGGSVLGTGAGTGSSPFVPSAAQWNQDTVDLTPFVGQSNVIVMFINRGHYGDALYLDNINITGTVSAAPSATINSVTSACTGQSINLTATTTGGPTSYSWVTATGSPTGAATASTTVTYSTPGVKTVSLTVANGTGTTTATKSITITATPTVVPSYTAATICAGNSTTLTVSGATTYTWAPTGTGTVSVLSPTATTVYSITGSTSGCTSAVRTITVNVTALPVVTLTPASSTICASQSATLTASGAATYTWAPSGSGTSSVVSPTATTVYTVTGTSSGCNSVPKTATVNVTSVPVITVTPTSTTICRGKNTTLTATGGTTYSWMPGSLTGASVVVSPTITTTYTVTGSTGSCNSLPKNASVTVVASPTLVASTNNSLICTGYTSTLTVTGNATSYSWTPAASLSSSTGNTVAASPTVTTTYTVTGTLGTCTTNTFVTQNVSLCTGIESLTNSNAWMIYPNPSQGVFTLAYGSQLEELQVEVINTIGQTIKSEEAKNVSQLKIDLTKMAKGVYYLKVNSSEGHQLFKLILE